MNNITAPQLALDQVKAEFDLWRKQRVGRARIPERLWASAIELLYHYPISQVQKQLNLNLKQLKQRSQTQERLLSQQQFLEIKPAEIATITDQQYSANNSRPLDSVSAVAKGSCQIAFERSDGSRLTISLPADSAIIPAICTNLLRA